MKLKIIMDSGMEYTTEKFSSVESFLKESLTASGVNYASLDEEKNIWINVSKVSSIEV